MGYLIFPEKFTEKNFSFSTKKSFAQKSIDCKNLTLFQVSLFCSIDIQLIFVFMEVMFYKVTMTMELMNTEQLLLGEIKG